ncbi:hypothetical protein AAG906_021369 [Vitis piasezkii]
MQGEEERESAMKHILDDTFLYSVVDFLLKLPDICDKLEAESRKLKANRDCEISLLLRSDFDPFVLREGSSARMQSFVVSAINEEEVKSFSDFYNFLELPTLGKLLDSRRHPLVISCELEKGSPRLKITLNGAPAGHESAETPIGHESNGAVAGEGVKSIVIPFQSTCDFHHKFAITNLSKVVGDFVGNQEATNAQINQRIVSGEYFE